MLDCRLRFKRQNKNIICSLDLNLAVIEEAIKAKANLIVTHHPLIFNEQKILLQMNESEIYYTN